MATSTSPAFPDGDTPTILRTTEKPVRSIKGQRPRTASTTVPRRGVKQVLTQNRQEPPASRQNPDRRRTASPGATDGAAVDVAGSGLVVGGFEYPRAVAGVRGDDRDSCNGRHVVGVL